MLAVGAYEVELTRPGLVMVFICILYVCTSTYIYIYIYYHIIYTRIEQRMRYTAPAAKVCSSV